MNSHIVRIDESAYEALLEESKHMEVYIQYLRINRADDGCLPEVSENASYTSMSSESIHFRFIIFSTHESHAQAATSGNFAYQKAIMKKLKQDILDMNMENYPVNEHGVRDVILD